MSAEIPRGIRNANPGNLRRDSTQWLGLSETQSDPDFFTFTIGTYGIRAIARILLNYQREGVTTVREAINRYAPPVENDTGAYVNEVCEQCSVDPDKPVDFKTFLPAMVKAIIRQECGTNAGQPWYTDAYVNYAVSLA